MTAPASTSTALDPGDSNCPDGGSQFDAGAGTTYACNSARGLALHRRRHAAAAADRDGRMGDP